MPVSDRTARLAGLYAIADTGVVPRALLAEKADQALTGGARILQYRDKDSVAGQRRQDCETLLALCRRHHATFVVNDDVGLALEISADGVHLGRDDANVAATRRLAGDALLIGASCYDDLQRASEATRDGADYLAFGSFYASTIKPRAARPAPKILTEARSFGLPLAAIGGINPGNALPLLDAGADMLAVISAAFSGPDTEASCRQLASLFRHRPAPQRV